MNSVTNKPYVGIMVALKGDTEVSQFDRLDVTSEEVLLGIDEAIERAISG